MGTIHEFRPRAVLVEERMWKEFHGTLMLVGEMLGDDPKETDVKARRAVELMKGIANPKIGFPLSPVLPADLTADQMAIVQATIQHAVDETFKAVQLRIIPLVQDAMHDLCTSKLLKGL